MASLVPCPAPHRLSDSAFNSLRLWVLVALCLLRLLVTRPHLQAYLCLAKSRVEQLRREAGCIAAREIQQRVREPVVGGAWGAGWGFPSFRLGGPPKSRGSPATAACPPGGPGLLLRDGGQPAVPDAARPHPQLHAAAQNPW